MPFVSPGPLTEPRITPCPLSKPAANSTVKSTASAGIDDMESAVFHDCYQCGTALPNRLRKAHQPAGAHQPHCQVAYPAGVPLLEDCRRGLQTLLSQAALCSESYLIGQVLDRLPLDLPLPWLAAVGSAWSGLMERRDLDMALLHSALIASHYLLAPDNWLSLIADRAQQQLCHALGVCAPIGLNSGSDQANQTDEVLILLAMITLAGRYCCRTVILPAQRPVIRVAQGISGLFFRAVQYWQLISAIALPAAHARQAGARYSIDADRLLLTRAEKMQQRQQRAASRRLARQVKNQYQFEALREQQLGIQSNAAVRPGQLRSAGESAQVLGQPLIYSMALAPTAVPAFMMARPAHHDALINWPRRHATALSCLLVMFGLAAVSQVMFNRSPVVTPHSQQQSNVALSRVIRRKSSRSVSAGPGVLPQAMMAGQFDYDSMIQMRNDSRIAQFFSRHVEQIFFNRYFHPLITKIWHSFPRAGLQQVNETQFARDIYDELFGNVVFLSELSYTRNMCLDGYLNALYPHCQQMWAEWHAWLGDLPQVIYNLPPVNDEFSQSNLRVIHQQAAALIIRIPLQALKQEIISHLLHGKTYAATEASREMQLIMDYLQQWNDELKDAIGLNDKTTENAIRLIAADLFNDIKLPILFAGQYHLPVDDFSFISQSCIYLQLIFKEYDPEHDNKLYLLIIWHRILPTVEYLLSNATRGAVRVRLPLITSLLNKLATLYHLPQPTFTLPSWPQSPHRPGQAGQKDRDILLQYDRQHMLTGLMIAGALGAGGAIIGSKTANQPNVSLRSKMAGMVSGALAASLVNTLTMDVGAAGVAAGAAGIATGIVIAGESGGDGATIPRHALPAAGNRSPVGNEFSLSGVVTGSKAPAGIEHPPHHKAHHTTANAPAGAVLNTAAKLKPSSVDNPPSDIVNPESDRHGLHQLSSVVDLYGPSTKPDANIGLSPGVEGSIFSIVASMIFMKLSVLHQTINILTERLNSLHKSHQDHSSRFFQQALGLNQPELIERAKKRFYTIIRSVDLFLKQCKNQNYSNVVLLAPAAQTNKPGNVDANTLDSAIEPYLYAIRQEGIKILVIRSELVAAILAKEESAQQLYSICLEDRLMHEIIKLSTAANDYILLETTHRRPLPPAREAAVLFEQSLWQQPIEPALNHFINDFTQARGLPYPDDIFKFLRQRPELKANVLMSNTDHLVAMMRDFANEARSPMRQQIHPAERT